MLNIELTFDLTIHTTKSKIHAHKTCTDLFLTALFMLSKRMLECQWLTLITLAIKEPRSGKSQLEASGGEQFMRPYLENTRQKK
jgi:hypothetical protein